jgi:hypothetical protein
VTFVITVPACGDNVRFRVCATQAFRVKVLSCAPQLLSLSLSKAILRDKNFWAIAPDGEGTIVATESLTICGKLANTDK